MNSIPDSWFNDIAPDTNHTYVRTQIERLNSGKYDRDDCLFRIASNVDLLLPGEQIDSTNRFLVEQWVDAYNERYGEPDAETYAEISKLVKK
ncbi:hypothetical protein [Leptolyngbya sp. FACHB-16]|uniref:hypothetical protein n=1 Tax=unclassified Leptolyngbya TaxID=2650499 RepID=UPI0016854DC0|nr:hypothetical protein [Leptolyngbya sp. FACHB-16]MBD2156274.1 hypothetical protein [Leptolyngbya sp. FACHB-16]